MRCPPLPYFFSFSFLLFSFSLSFYFSFSFLLFLLAFSFFHYQQEIITLKCEVHKEISPLLMQCLVCPSLSFFALISLPSFFALFLSFYFFIFSSFPFIFLFFHNQKEIKTLKYEGPSRN